MKVKDLKDSRYLTKDDVDPPVNVTIKNVEKENVAMEGEEVREKFVMFFEELPKGIVLNMTNGMILEDITGSDDSDNWLGHTITLYSDHSIMFGGKRVGGIRIRNVKDSGHPPRENRPDMRQANRELQTESAKKTRWHGEGSPEEPY